MAAVGEAKLAKSLQTACKKHGDKAAKRTADDATSPTAKKPRLEPHKRDLDYGSMTPDELEQSLSLPLNEDEDAIRATTVVTNRAPLLLAFAIELARFTMPEQPPSSRLSLGQAVVSANSRAKATSLGLGKAPAGGPMAEGQPKVCLLGRDVPVLKRGDYAWPAEGARDMDAEPGTAGLAGAAAPLRQKTWTASQRLTSKSSIFIAHAAPLTSPSQRPGLIQQLMASKPHLESATHNAWAMRTSYGSSPLVQEASFDDGESGCGALMLGVMREADVKNTVVVLTRWFGGVMLGPDRWRLMRECVHEALLSQGPRAALAGEAVWGLDADDEPATSTVGMAIHRPEGARNYLLRSFDDGDAGAGRKTSSEDRHERLGRVLGAIRLLCASWAGVLARDELDRRAWTWYLATRPDVEAGPSGWGAKGRLSLGRILDLRRRNEGRGPEEREDVAAPRPAKPDADAG